MKYIFVLKYSDSTAVSEKSVESYSIVIIKAGFIANHILQYHFLRTNNALYRVIHNDFGVYVFIYADIVASRTVAQIKA